MGAWVRAPSSGAALESFGRETAIARLRAVSSDRQVDDITSNFLHDAVSWYLRHGRFTAGRWCIWQGSSAADSVRRDDAGAAAHFRRRTEQ